MVTLARRQLALPSMGWHSAARHSHKRMLSSSIGNRVGVTARARVGMGLVALVLAGAGQAAELRELLRFQQSAVGRKAARLTPVIASETAQAIDGEIRSSPGLPRMLAALQRAFPVLKPSESP